MSRSPSQEHFGSESAPRFIQRWMPAPPFANKLVCGKRCFHDGSFLNLPVKQTGWIEGGGRKERRKGEERTILGGDGFFVLMIFGTSNFKIMGMTNATLSVDIQEEGGREQLKKGFVGIASFGYLAIF